MQKFTLTLTDVAGNVGVAQGVLEAQTVTCGPQQWGDGVESEHTDVAEISFKGDKAPSVSMNGHAWREIEMEGMTDDFVRLLWLSEDKAAKVAELAGSNSTYYRVLVTRDISTASCGTEYCTAYTTFADKEAALKDSGSAYVSWAPNDETYGPGAPYLCEDGHGDSGFEEIEIDELISGLLKDAKADAEATARAQAFGFVAALATLHGESRLPAVVTELVAKAVDILEMAQYYPK